MSNNIAPFITLNSAEKELSKNEIAAYLEMYYVFNVNIINNADISYFENFKRLKNKYINYTGDKTLSNIIREASFFTEYDNMIQIAKIYTLNKFFSYYIDSNLCKIGELGNNSVDEKYFLPGSTKYNIKETINFIRNAFNHNDKEGFQLFRLIQKQNDPNLYIEIFLRKPNFHIMLTVEDLFDLLEPILHAKSAYSYLYYDEKGKIIQTLSQFEENINKRIEYEIMQIYDFDNNQLSKDNYIIHDDETNKANKFYKRFQFSEEQMQTIRNSYQMLKTNNLFTDNIIISSILRSTIPFGMSKVESFLVDLKYCLPSIFNLEDCYSNWQQQIYEKLKYNSEEEAIQSFEKEVYTLNGLDRINRAFIIFSSYVLDSIILEKSDININGIELKKDRIRNSFVHGTYFNYIPNDKSDMVLFLYDYEHKNKKGKTDNNLILEDAIINKFSMMDLYETLLHYIKIDDYSLPLDFIINLDRFDGICLTFKESSTRYYINASFNNKTPIFLGVKDLDGAPLYMDDKDFQLLKDKISKLNFNLLDMFDEKTKSFIKRIPEISSKATKNYINLSEKGNLSSETYFGPLKKEIDELKNICARHYIIPQKEIKKINEEEINTYKY